MIKAKFNGDTDNESYQCAEFNCRKNDTVSMPNARWTTIGTEGKQDLFDVILIDDIEFPAQKTIG